MIRKTKLPLFLARFSLSASLKFSPIRFITVRRCLRPKKTWIELQRPNQSEVTVNKWFLCSKGQWVYSMPGIYMKTFMQRLRTFDAPLHIIAPSSVVCFVFVPMMPLNFLTLTVHWVRIINRRELKLQQHSESVNISQCLKAGRQVKVSFGREVLKSSWSRQDEARQVYFYSSLGSTTIIQCALQK